jgi:putative SOS response-associated peptidase YedK
VQRGAADALACVVRRHPDTGERRLDLLRRRPGAALGQDLKGYSRPINARAETVAASGMFPGSLAAHRRTVSLRCVLSMDTDAGSGQPMHLIGRQIV